MFAFDNMLVAGTVLVRNRMESQNWESSGHTDGWAVYANGDAFFFNITASGDIQANSLSTGDPGVEILNYLDQIPRVKWQLDEVDEIEPADIIAVTRQLNLTAARWDSDFVQLSIQSVSAANAEDGGFSFRGSTEGPTGASIFEVLDCLVRIARGTGVTPSSTDHPFQIGLSSGANLRADADEIQFANNGAAADGKIQESGGNITFGGQILGMRNFESGSFTAAATAGTPTATSTTAVSFAHTFPATPRIFLCPRASTAGVVALREFGVTGASTTGFNCNINRTDTSTTLFDYIAISGLG